MFALPGLTILGMRSLRSLRIFQVSFAHALTPWGEPRGRLSRPRPNAAALGGKAGPRRGGRAAAEVRRLRGGDGPKRSQTPELSQPRELCRGGERMTSCLFWCQVILRKQNEGRLVQVDPFPVSA